MNLSDVIFSAFDYARGFFSRFLDWLILLILTIIPIVDFIAIGYYGKVVRDNPASKTPPKLEGYGDMFVSGLKVFVVALIYAIPEFIIAILLIAPFLALAVFSGVSLLANPLAYMVSLLPYIAIISVVALIIGIIELMGIVHMFKTGSFGKAFAFGEILQIIGKIGWLRYLAFVILCFIASWLIGVIAAIPLVGWIISSAISVIVITTIARSLGLLYDGAIGEGALAPPTTATMGAPPTRS